MESKLIELTKKGKAMIITDLHGNLEDYFKYMELWNAFKGPDKHLIITGDFIHALENDGSIEIIESLIELNKDPMVHILLGNHELAQLTGENVFKNRINQTKAFNVMMYKAFGIEAYKKHAEYKEFFNSLAIAVKTANGVLISHAGPSLCLRNINDLKYVTINQYDPVLYEMVWNSVKFDNLESCVDMFLARIGCKVSIVGHTPVYGAELIGNQLIVASSFGATKKTYVILDLETDIKNGWELLKHIELKELILKPLGFTERLGIALKKIGVNLTVGSGLNG